MIVRETEIIDRLRRFATAPEARGLLDDVALLDGLVITHDTIAEGVHFLSSDPPASVGWKLVAVNLSDLAAKGATPAGALLSLTISGPSKWAIDFLSGVDVGNAISSIGPNKSKAQLYVLPLVPEERDSDKGIDSEADALKRAMVVPRLDAAGGR